MKNGDVTSESWTSYPTAVGFTAKLFRLTHLSPATRWGNAAGFLFKRRLDLAAHLASQRGRSYTGLPPSERDAYLDVAGETLKALDARLAAIRQKVELRLENDTTSTPAP